MEMNEERKVIRNATDMYQFLVQRYILEKTRLDRIDVRMQEYKIPFISYQNEERDRYQVKDYMKLKYIYMRNDVHCERLTSEQIAILEKARKHLTEEQAVRQAMMLVQDTYKKVLPFSENESDIVELFPSVSGTGNVEGDSIVFVIATKPEYDEGGSIKDWENERVKDKVLYSLKTQLEPMCERILGMRTKVLIV